MAYSRRNIADEHQEARINATQIAAICKDLKVTIDPIDWQTFGMQAPVTVKKLEIAPLANLSQRDHDYILRRIQIKLFEHAALTSLESQAPLKALMWSPVEVVQPQDFLSLWVVTLENDERIPIVESIKNGERAYEVYSFDAHSETQLSTIFGPASKGDYQRGDRVRLKERDREYEGEVVYVIPPGKVTTTRRPTTRGYQSGGGKIYNSENAARYIVDCGDGFPHVVNQTQILNEKAE